MVYFSKWIRTDYTELYTEIVTILEKHGEAHGLLPHTKDYWCRDYMPIPLSDGCYLQYRYFPNYLNNIKNSKYITDPTEDCKSLGIKTIKTDIILDGGNVVRCGDKVVMIDKIFSENPSYERNELIAELERLLEAKLVLLPWDRNEKYGHSDGVVRYLGDDRVLLTNYRDYDQAMHERFVKILSEHFKVEELSYTEPNPENNSWAYINFLQTDSVIILPKFSTHKDQEALEQIEQYFPKYKGRIEQVDARKIVAEGGALNCISWATCLVGDK